MLKDKNEREAGKGVTVATVLEPSEHERLRDVAWREGRSVSSLIRGLVRERLERLQQEEAHRG